MAASTAGGQRLRKVVLALTIILVVALAALHTITSQTSVVAHVNMLHVNVTKVTCDNQTTGASKFGDCGTCSDDNHKESGASYLKQYNESKFNFPEESLTTIGFPLKNFITLNNSNVQDFVFVTAANTYYYPVAYDVIGNIQRHFPTRKIIFYDLEVSPKKAMQNKFSAYCNVEYRQFPFASFPSHVKGLKFYTWKPLVIHTVLQEYSGVFWVDSSIRFKTSNLCPAFDFVQESGGVMLFSFSSHNVFISTHRDMYNYLPTNVTKMPSTPQMEANSMLFYRTESFYNSVVRWWVACALTRECMAPPAAKLACKNYEAPKAYLDCHRYDQSAINVILSNAYDFDSSRYSAATGILNVLRGSKGLESPFSCAK